MIKAIIVNNSDNIAVAVEDITSSETVKCRTKNDIILITVAENIPIFHKVSLVDIKRGDVVIKYGETIGIATKDINKGCHAHLHNVMSKTLYDEQEAK